MHQNQLDSLKFRPGLEFGFGFDIAKNHPRQPGGFSRYSDILNTSSDAWEDFFSYNNVKDFIKVENMLYALTCGIFYILKNEKKFHNTTCCSFN